MGALIDAASWLLLLAGSAFCVIGGVGMIRLPDFYTRGHAASLTDTLGATLILLGLALQSGLSLVTVKLVFILLFIYLTSPTAAHALVKAAYAGGVAAPGVEGDPEAAEGSMSDRGGAC
ncbi:MAG: monovalent cation/H(+) antiporter subunit G [bacterium]